MKGMKAELSHLNENQTWKLVDLPNNSKALPCRWVFRVKTTPNGTKDKYKALLVITVFNQHAGIDYNEIFSSVARMDTICALISVAAIKELELAQFDVSTAFLYGELEEDIFMRQPPGFHDGTNKVCELKISLYGLIQAPRCWNKRS